MATARNNILIISDLHLGEDIKPAGSGHIKHLVLLERELVAFLEHYRRTRRDGLPWELIVNGDMVDFLSVCLLPQDDESHPATEVSEEDTVYGLSSKPKAARAKMQKVLARHPSVFKALGAFVAAGNKLSIVVGNHDVEFHWPLVQETFKLGIAALWSATPASLRPGAMTGAEVAAQITFHPWFYFQENVVWVEHGHQYDEFCSFDYVLNPVEPERNDEIMPTLGGASYRYIANHIKGMDPHQAEEFSAVGYVRMTLGLGWRGIKQMVRGYTAFAACMLSMWRKLSKVPEKVEVTRLGHREKLRALAHHVRLSEDTLVALDDLRQRPAIRNLFKLVMVLMLDRIALLAVTTALILTFFLAFPTVAALPAVAVALFLAWCCGQFLARQHTGTDPSQKMKVIPERIRRIVRAPFVVFGHSHKPVALPLDEGGMYFNTGTWVATERPGLLHAFTHVMIRHAADGPKATLCQWRDGTSQTYVPRAAAAAKV
jgi:UDP-2,3-diacylglucosamine pyrophosphatase LpxH